MQSMNIMELKREELANAEDIERSVLSTFILIFTALSANNITVL